MERSLGFSALSVIVGLTLIFMAFAPAFASADSNKGKGEEKRKEQLEKRQKRLEAQLWSEQSKKENGRKQLRDDEENDSDEDSEGNDDDENDDSDKSSNSSSHRKNIDPEIAAQINARLATNPITITSLGGFLRFFKKDFREHCLPWGHLFAPGWVKTHPTEWAAQWERCFGENPTTPEAPDTSAPVISNVGVHDIASTSATVRWNTNEAADSRVFYSTTSPVATSTASTTVNATRVRNHALALSALTPTTTYYYIVVSKDAAGNTATSTQHSFTTNSTPADVTAPVISLVLITGVSSSTALVSWNTNEGSTERVYYSTTTPVNTAVAPSIGTTTLSSFHSVALTGLASSTTYYLLIESKDAANNTATTSVGFATTN